MVEDVYEYKDELYCSECSFLIDCDCIIRETQYSQKVTIEESDWPEHCSSGAQCVNPINLGYTVIGAFLPVGLNTFGYALVRTASDTPLTKIWKDYYLESV